MTPSPAGNTHLRRRQDYPVLLLSQDYELFFHRSGSIENCLFKPSALLVEFAKKIGIRITFYVDAGMLCRMQELQSEHAILAKDLSRIKQNIESLHASGHEIALHIHPHWEDTKWANGHWDFSATRYQLRDFSDVEVDDIVHRYSAVLNDLCNGDVSSYRAGGFCIEPFARLGQALIKCGISVDSSVVPGAQIRDKDKGFDFSHASHAPWWKFQESPMSPDTDGKFIEIPITPISLPVFHYWGRALDRLLKRQPAGVSGDGASKALGKSEVVRRLCGGGRVSEMSIDAPKAGQLLSPRVLRQDRDVWHVMGHPKLLGEPSLLALEKFIAWKDIGKFETVSGLATAIRSQGSADEGGSD